MIAGVRDWIAATRRYDTRPSIITGEGMMMVCDNTVSWTTGVLVCTLHPYTVSVPLHVEH